MNYVHTAYLKKCKINYLGFNYVHGPLKHFAECLFVIGQDGNLSNILVFTMVNEAVGTRIKLLKGAQ